jgi:hypothetical protein
VIRLLETLLHPAAFGPMGVLGNAVTGCIWDCMGSDQVAHEFELGKRGWVRATIDTFKQKRYASVRLWVEPRETPGAELIPTSKGLTVPIEFVPELVEAVLALGEAVKGKVAA